MSKTNLWSYKKAHGAALSHGPADPESEELVLYGEWSSVTLGAIKHYAGVSKLGALTLRLNGALGAADRGLAGYEALSGADGEVTATVDGYAGGATLLVALAAKKRIAYPTSVIYPALRFDRDRTLAGSSEERDAAAEIYRAVLGCSSSHARRLVDCGKPLTAQDALRSGWVHEIAEPTPKSSAVASAARHLVLVNATVQALRRGVKEVA